MKPWALGFINSMSQVTLIKKKKIGSSLGKAAAQISCRTSKPFKPESQKAQRQTTPDQRNQSRCNDSSGLVINLKSLMGN